ncbi:hypothetical protein [Streptomyces sp. NPDC096142]|uniref:hypothetical protein n=1 Tax=Streptomyces sp. NPDC096142 TaxID=3366077 RepID=UPI00381BFB4D
MTKHSIPVQAAIVHTLIAKRPLLGTLPVDWQLQQKYGITVTSSWGAAPDVVVQIAQEVARALRGVTVEVSHDKVMTASGRPYRSHRVDGRQSGVPVYYNGVEYLDGHGDEVVEGGETA